MKPRTCPNCGYKYSLSEYYKIIFFNSYKWNCKKCNVELSYDIKSRFIILFISMVPILFATISIRNIQSLINTSYGISFFIFFTFLIIWSVAVYSFVTFKTTKK